MIEDGIYSITGEHEIIKEDKIFNIQEVIFATLDDEVTLKDYALVHDQHEIAEYFDQFQ